MELLEIQLEKYTTKINKPWRSDSGSPGVRRLIMYYLDNGNIRTKLEDLRDQVSEDIYQAVEGMHQEELGKSLCNLSITTYERDAAEHSLETCHLEMNNAYRIVKDLELYLDSAKRINRDYIKDTIRGIAELIENSIDA